MSEAESLVLIVSTIVSASILGIFCGLWVAILRK